MQKIRVLIVEDEWIVSEEIKELLDRNGYEIVGQTEDDLGALRMLDTHQVDVALLDINIKGERDGIELAEEIAGKHSCAIIFLTAYDDEQFLNRAKKVRPAAYIVKPFEARNLQNAIEIAFNNQIATKLPPREESYTITDFIFIRENSRFKKVSIESILFVEALGSYTDIYTDSGKITLAINLKTFTENLDNPKFMRIHRSFLINLSKIDEYEGNCVFINKTMIPISSTHKDEFLNRFKFF